MIDLQTARQGATLLRTAMTELMEDALGGDLANPAREGASGERLGNIGRDLCALALAIAVLERRRSSA